MGPKPIPLFGNFKDVILGKVHMADFIQDIYHQFASEPVVGLFASNIPILLVKDPEIIQEVLVKGFSNFSDRGFTHHGDVDSLSQHLLYMTVDKWKPMRQKLSPVFTSTKLKEMFYSISACADNFSAYTRNLVKKNEIVDCFTLTRKYAIDVIGICAFGLETKILSQEKTEFERVSEMIFENSVKNTLKRLIRFCPNWIKKLTKPVITNHEVVNFFMSLIEKNIAFRNTNNLRRNDLVDILMDIKNHPEKIGEKEATLALLTSQAYVFFAAGFDTTSSTITHALYEVALNQNIQNQLRTEICTTIQKYSGNLNYDVIYHMKYLDQVLKETLRKYPPGYFTGRRAIDDYTFKRTKITVRRDIRVLVPIHAIHNDPNNYPEPDKFDPERFTEEAEKMRHPMTFLPFGAGPRYCIGKRFAFISTKIAIARIISRFKFETLKSPNAEIPKDRML
ncbi:probable cytochrome P450 6a14 [Copidosoma floridanum]|uniref:probable cytochrome P450 6a14 n=1 Tax=Copidosoma floridanum TaxID=29053 RepID=UPI000C6F815A|nr:probable cytochrome P450 6a14 [Copidosoma floridanum]